MCYRYHGKPSKLFLHDPLQYRFGLLVHMTSRLVEQQNASVFSINPLALLQ